MTMIGFLVNPAFAPAATPGACRITPAERAQRAEAVRYARASVGFEGLHPTPTWEAIQVRYVAGELTTEQMIAAVKAATP